MGLKIKDALVGKELTLKMKKSNTGFILWLEWRGGRSKIFNLSRKSAPKMMKLIQK